MQAIMEPVFEIPYLIGVVALGIQILRKADGRKERVLFGVMAIVLGCGDAFHLIPRIFALWSGGTANYPEALGLGKLVTSITMTVFYVLLYHVLCFRYGKRGLKAQTNVVYMLAAARVILCLFPQNQWFITDSPLEWGIYRNLPFVALGILIISLSYQKYKRGDDRPFKWMWLAITLSFAFYIPVVLFADALPAIGALMVPKTCAYVWIVWMGYADARDAKFLYKTKEITT